MSPHTIPTRVMIMSDTHEHSFDGTNMPSVDVLLHTGDLTNFGELESLRESVRMLDTFTAELKLVIAGNHDISLDPTRRVENMSDEEYATLHERAIEIMTGKEAINAGIVYLEEGMRTFSLSNGAKFTVYTSPYTPGSGGWGFPHSILDQVDSESLGCPHLLRAIGRARPLLHCFGHIHEGHGAHIVTWKPDGTVKNPTAATPMETEQMNKWPYANEWEVERRRQTLMVNAAIMRNTARGMRPDLKPFIVLLGLPQS